MYTSCHACNDQDRITSYEPGSSISLLGADDFHMHLRDGAVLPFTVQCCAKQFDRAIVMPNIKPPVTSVALALAYRERILAALPAGSTFTPLMTMYMTDKTTPEIVREAKATGLIFGIKLYPAGATTNSDSGVTDISKLDATLEVMQEVGMPLLVHGEVTDPDVDIFDREEVFIESIFRPLVARFPKLKFVMEHITTKEGVAFVRDGPPNVAGTITAHHLMYNRNALLVGGIKPHFYCLPILKAEKHRVALVEAATSGNPKFFLGTDSAPHPKFAKESVCGCAGVFTAHVALELYAEIFEKCGAMQHFEAFCSHHGADFYGLARNERRIELKKQKQDIPMTYAFGPEVLRPLRAGERIEWVVVPSSDPA